MSRSEHFHESAGNPIIGYNTGDEVVCRDCGKNSPELAMVNPKDVSPIKLSHVGEGPRASYPDGFTCAGCGDTIGAWDYKGDR